MDVTSLGRLTFISSQRSYLNQDHAQSTDRCSRRIRLEHLANLKLADPDFHVSGPISILLGAEIIGLLMEKGFIRGGRNAPHAFCTKLGWILLVQYHATGRWLWSQTRS